MDKVDEIITLDEQGNVCATKEDSSVSVRIIEAPASHQDLLPKMSKKKKNDENDNDFIKNIVADLIDECQM